MFHYLVTVFIIELTCGEQDLHLVATFEQDLVATFGGSVYVRPCIGICPGFILLIL